MSRKSVVNDVSKLSKGDKLRVVSGIPSPFQEQIMKKGKLVDNYYIFNGVNNGSVILRNVAGRVMSYRISDVEGGYLQKCYEWTDWRSVPNDSNALYKTNRRRIWYKKGGFKVKADCNLNYDKFDLATGLQMCKERWNEELVKILPKTVEEDNNMLNLEIVEVQDDLFNAPFYNYVVHCINTDFKARGYIGEKIDKIYAINSIYELGLETYSASYKEEDENDPVLMTYRNVISLLVSDPYCKATYSRLKKCLYELAWYCYDKGIEYLAMPKICCGANGLDWDQVKSLIEVVFENTLEEYLDNNAYLYDEDEPFNVHISVYTGKINYLF